MDTNPVFNRRHNHNNTPASVTLIITNFIVFGLSTQLFTSCAGINAFWVVLAALAIYNYFTIRKYREDYDKPQVIAYVLSLVIMIGLYFVLRYSQHC